MFPRTMVQRKLLNNFQVVSNSRRHNVVTSVDPSGDPISIPSYVPIVNLSRAPSGQHLGYLQEVGPVASNHGNRYITTLDLV